MASYAENVSIWWRHHDFSELLTSLPRTLFSVISNLKKCVISNIFFNSSTQSGKILDQHHRFTLKLRLMKILWTFFKFNTFQIIADASKLCSRMLKCHKMLLKAGLEGFGRYPVFTMVFTGKYRPGKNMFWTPKVGKTGKNTTSIFFKQFSTSIKDLIGPWNIET